MGKLGQGKYIDPWSLVTNLEKWQDFHQLTLLSLRAYEN